MRLLVVAVAGVALLGGCASLMTPSGAAAQRWAALDRARAAKAAGATDAQKICKNLPVMGSNFPKKVCSTQEEWDAFNAQEREKVDQFDADRRAGATESAFERGQ